MAEETRLTIRCPDDWHLHLRDGALLESVAKFSALQFARAIIMPNLTPPITTAQMAVRYRARIAKALGPLSDTFTPLMTCYLIDDISAVDVETGHSSGAFFAAKLYPWNATTNAQAGVKDIRTIRRVLATMERIGMPLLVHGETVSTDVDVFDREAVFIDRTLEPLIRDFPGLKIVLEHITTQEATDFIRSIPSRVAATITPQHLMLNRNAIFQGGLRPHHYCLPVLKRERHRLALRRAAVSGDPRFFAGTDSAPHPRIAKETACGCAGIFNAPVAMACYATVFAEEQSLDRLEWFASVSGSRFYGLPTNESMLTLEQTQLLVPDEIELAGGGEITPFMAGQVLNWKVSRHESPRSMSSLAGGHHFRSVQ